jgi:ribose transport system permease protein
MSGSENISVPDHYVKLIGGELFGSDTRNGIPYAVIMMIGAALIVHVILTRTRRGRAMYALGGNEEATRLSGIPMVLTTTFVFALSGLLAGFAAVVQLARASVASRDAGMSYELFAVAAAVIGGTSLTGGQGGVPGTIIGAFLIYTISNGCVLLDYPPDYQTAIIGLVVVLAVLYDHFDLGARSIYAVLRLFGRRIDMKR